MKKTIANSFLIIGNTIGSGILALPLVTAVFGFFPSILILTFAWLVMTYSAKLLLECSYWVKDEQNLVTILSMTLPKSARLIVSLLYLAMMYGMLVAYISISSDLTQAVLTRVFSLDFPYYSIVLLFTLVFGVVVFYSMDVLERYTRYLVVVLLLIFLFMVLSALPHVSLSHLQMQHYHGLIWTLPLALLCFGYPMIVPSLRQYYGDQKMRAVHVIMLGSFLALLMYVLWLFAVLGAMPLEGTHGINALPDQKISSLTAALQAITHNHYLSAGLTTFAYFAVATSFMSIAKIVFDFLNDAFLQLKLKRPRLTAQVLTLLPPVMISVYIPGLFVYALMFSGAIIGMLLVFLPALLVWRGRYQRNFSHFYQCEGGKSLLIAMMAIGLVVAFIEIFQNLFF
ncbi:MAG TPA: aromatic amino acid transport family protein [Gammaproteobacteria bacterium]|nr:aromatic amino acid transport family protein [Gammaproteobacteria bacterium]